MELSEKDGSQGNKAGWLGIGRTHTFMVGERRAEAPGEPICVCEMMSRCPQSHIETSPLTQVLFPLHTSSTASWLDELTRDSTRLSCDDCSCPRSTSHPSLSLDWSTSPRTAVVSPRALLHQRRSSSLVPSQTTTDSLSSQSCRLPLSDSPTLPVRGFSLQVESA